jgi:5,10-methylenetetrahydromethanopterin reductase
MAGEALTTTEGPSPLTNVRLAIAAGQAEPPIYLAAIGPRALRLAGAIADGVLLNAYTPVDYVKYAAEEVRKAAQDAGRDPDSVDIACMLIMRQTDEPERLWPDLKRRIVRLLEEPRVGEILLEKGGFDPSILEPLRASVQQDRGASAVDLISDDMVDAFYLVGSAEYCKERVAAYRNAGVNLPLLLPRLEDFENIARTHGSGFPPSRE